MFTKEEKAKALELYASTHSVKKTMIQLGYPSKSTLLKWLNEGNCEPKPKRIYYMPDRPSRQASLELKWTTLKRCFEAGEDVSKVAKEIGFHRVTVYNWRKKYVEEGSVGLMDGKKIPRQPLEEGTSGQASSDDIQELKKQVRRLQFELDVMKEIVHVIKKGLGVNPNPLSNKEKTVVVDALKDRYSQSQLLNYIAFPRSSYYYGLAKQQQADKYDTLREMIQRIFQENHCAYGYRRIWAVLRKRGCLVSEKVVRRLMADADLQIAWRKKRRYRSYQGEVSPAVDNLLERDFKADKPNEKWLTDITEFHIPAGKVYLSPIIDCFDGLVVSWALSTAPDAALANRSLKQAIETLKDETPIVHTDRGGHYRWPDWIRLMGSHHLIRSMSKKGCSPDNAACEGFFGRLKNECFYHATFAMYTTAAFMAYIDEYIQWYNQKRIKQSLGYLSPVEYRQQFGAA